jgi:hypothetical protein
MTAREMIASSLRLIGVLAAGETASANEASDALTSLNQMLSAWSNENLVVYQKVRDEFTLTVNDGSYSWGTTAGSGNFTTARPVQVLKASIELQGTDPQEIPLKILTLEEYAEISLKGLDSSIPNAVYFDGAFPNVGVEFFPIPSAAEHVVFYSLKPFSTLTLSTELSYPPGYEKAIRYNLAIDLAPEYGRPIDPDIRQQAMDTKAEIKRKNIQTPKLKMDVPASSGRSTFDYRTGE